MVLPRRFIIPNGPKGRGDTGATRTSCSRPASTPRAICRPAIAEQHKLHEFISHRRKCIVSSQAYEVSVGINADDHDLLYNLATLLGDAGRTPEEARRGVSCTDPIRTISMTAMNHHAQIL